MPLDYDRYRSWWDARALTKVTSHGDAVVNCALCWREIDQRLDGVQTILDIGAGAGDFSIPLARRGYKVTHLDLSPAAIAQGENRINGQSNIQFVEANASDLSRFQDCSFDLVLNLDGAISFCGPDAIRALRESCRVAAKTLIVSVTNRACMISVAAASSIEQTGTIGRPVYIVFDQGEWTQEKLPENAVKEEDGAEVFPGPVKAFLAGELHALLEDCGFRVERVGGLGSLANLCGPEATAQALENDELLGEYLSLCERFDTEVLPDGPGTRQRAGLLGVASRR